MSETYHSLFDRHYLTPLLEPAALAVIGASERMQSVGNTLFKNILRAGYGGRLYPVNPKYESVHGVRAYRSIEEIAERIDMVIIATPAQMAPQIIEQCGQRGIKNVLVTADGFSETGKAGGALERQMIEAARCYKLRVLGPNCLGLIRPTLKLSALAVAAPSSVSIGHLALVSSSAAICLRTLDWAKRNRVGFSSVVSLGDMADIDFGEVIDYLVYDPQTHGILLHIETIRNARRFMNSLRSAARVKPIVLLKTSGVMTDQVQAGTIISADKVLDDAARRAGVVRVGNVGQFFDAAKALAAASQRQSNQAQAKQVPAGKPMSTYRQHQQFLLRTLAPSVRQRRDATQNTQNARRLIDTALLAGKKTLADSEAQTLLQMFGIPLVLTGATDTDEALNRFRQVRPHARALMVGVVCDPVFGPTIVFGSGGKEEIVASDHAVALPPLNAYLADELVRATDASRRLGEFGNMPPVQEGALESVLLNISELICALPGVQTLDLNPLIVDEHGALAAAARITIARSPSTGNRNRDRYLHMAIPPYPVHLVQEQQLPDGERITLRPIHPADAAMSDDFIARLSAASKYACFMNTPGETIRTMLIRGTQIDYDGELSLLATALDTAGKEQKIGVARYINLDGESVEFSLLVADDWQKRGVGRQLLAQLIECAHTYGYRFVVGDVQAANERMLQLIASLGFCIQPHPEEKGVMAVVKPLFL